MEVIWYFLIYSLLGFGLEVAFARATRAEKQDRKCLLFLPLCPVYGIGATAIVLLPAFIRDRPLLLCPAGALLATGVEYLMSVFYEKLWHVSFWDYSDLPHSLRGRVCLPFSAAWGILCLPLVFWLQPSVAHIAALLPDLLLVPVLLVFGVDSALTGHLLRRWADTNILKWYE